MNRRISANNMKTYFVIALGLLLIASCEPKEYKKIPLENVDPKLKTTGSVIIKDILASFNDNEGARYLLDKDYVTPLVHARLMKNLEKYDESFKMSSMAIGNVSKYKLFQVIDKGVIKAMRYKLETDSDNMKFIELRIDINSNYGLADFYLYLTTKDGFLKGKNVFPKAIK